jgi:hypothetical protein
MSEKDGKLFSDDIDARLREVENSNEDENLTVAENTTVKAEKENEDNMQTAPEINFLDIIKFQTQPDRILKTCYDLVNFINQDERTLTNRKIELSKMQNDYSELKRDFLTDKELMAKWKAEYDITNNDGRLLKIDEELKDLIEDKEKAQIVIKDLEVEIAGNKRLLTLHLEVLKRMNYVILPHELK